MPSVTNPVNANSTGFQSINSSGAWNGRTLIAGPGISITNADGIAGNPTISSNALTWTDEATSFAAASNNGYFVIGTLTATLPASPSNGDIISFVVDGSFVSTIQAAAGQTIRISQNVSSTAGTQANTAAGDTLTLVYRSTNTRWEATSFVGAWNFT
jgi:hypothetical protein